MVVETHQGILLNIDDLGASLSSGEQRRDSQPVGDVAVVVDQQLRIVILDRRHQLANVHRVADASHILDAENDLIDAAGKGDNLMYYAQVVRIGGPVGHSKRDRWLEEATAFHHHFSHRAHIAHIVEERKAAPDINIHL